MKYEIIVVADFNDGDYISERSIIDEDELKNILPILRKVNANKDYDWNEGWELDGKYQYHASFLTKEEDGHFSQYTPSHEGESFHTIESVEVYEYIERKNLI